MPKRKNPFPTSHHGTPKKPRPHTDPTSLPPRAIQAVHVAVTAAIGKGNTSVFRALKKAARFQTRKLIKRIKSARKESADVTKLEAELAVAKALSADDIKSLAKDHLLRTLGKRKRVVSPPLWPATLVVPVVEEEKREKANVVSRMCGAAVVRAAVNEVVGAVEAAMGVDEGGVEDSEPAKVAMKTTMETVGEEAEVAAEADSSSDREVELSDHDRVVEESEEFMGFSDPLEGAASGDEATSREADAPQVNNDELWDRLIDPHSADLAEFDERIGGSSSSDSEAAANELNRTDDEWSGASTDNNDDDDDDEASPSPPPPPPPPKKETSAVAAPPKKPAAPTSQFLPSLMSGYVSGGDSDPDAGYYEVSSKKRGLPEKKERKNRMGQQARRALWEKKFGVRANHVKKAEQEVREKQEARAARAAARGEKRKAGVGKDEPGPLHPSWEAARKAKEKQAQVAKAMMGKPQGKKITFD